MTEPDLDAAPRLFVPLATLPYEWFVGGAKTWELRRDRGQFRSDRLAPGRRVELRRGYSDKSSSIWGTVLAICVSKSLVSFFECVPFAEVIPDAATKDEATTIASGILSLDPHEPAELVGIQIRVDPPYGPSRSSKASPVQNPPLKMATAYMDDVLAGRKTTTVRRGTDRYRTGAVTIVSDEREIGATIHAVEDLAAADLTDDLATADGFANVHELRQALRSHYPELDLKHGALTVLRFEVDERT